MPEKKSISEFLPVEAIEQHIYLIRGHKVMLSTHLAMLYAVEPRVLVQSVKRNPKRFPDDFMFHLDAQEFAALKSQIVTSKQGGLRRAMPYAFTEEGVAMLSSILNSDRAIAVNITIMRVFVRLREMLASHVMLLRRLDELEKEQKEQGLQIGAVFEVIRKLTSQRTRNRQNARWDFGESTI
jgi:ORF6N domain-containing protein